MIAKRDLTIVAGIFLCAGQMAAQPVLTDTVALKEVVVTATKTERRPDEIPGKAEVINNREIRHLPAQKPDDLLRMVSGVNVHRNTGIYSMRPTVTLRGISGDEQGRTLVLMNGVPMNTSDEGGVNWNRLNPYSIGKIEIFKGPGSSLYGNNAMGGVINIITRKPEKGFEADAGISYGTFNTFKPELWMGGSPDKQLTWSLSGFYQSSDGYNNVPESMRSDPDYTVPRFLKEGSLSGNISYRINELLNVEVQHDYYRDKRGEGEKIQAPDGEYRHFTTNFSRLRFSGRTERLNYDLNLYFQREAYFRLDERMRGPNYSRFDVQSDRDDYGAIFNTNYELTDHQIITAGIEYKNGRVDGGDYYVTSEDAVTNRGALRSASVYLQDEVRLLSERIRIIGGIRFDHVNFFDGEYSATGSGVDYWAEYSPDLSSHTWNAVSPRIAVRGYLEDNISAYASYSRGFRASILDDLCRSGWMWVGPKVANPGLGPEYLDNFEGGLDLEFFGKLNVEPTVYHATGKDFLYYVATGDSLFGRPMYRRQNVTEVGINGAEMDLSYALNSYVTFRASYTWNKSSIRSFDERPGLEGKELKYTPNHRASAGMIWLNDVITTGLYVLYKDRQYTTDDNAGEIDGYWTMDLQLSHGFLGDRMKASLMVRDLLDNEHMETSEYISPGRLISAGISYSF